MFCLDFSVMSKNGLIRKIRLISKFITSQPGSETNAIHLFTNASRKGNQAMIFGHLIERNIINIFFLKNHTENPMKILFKIEHISGSIF